MFNLKVYVDSNSFGVKNAEAVAAVRSALEIFNTKILKEQCRIDDFAVVETDNHRKSDIIVSRARRGLNRRDRQWLQRLSVELIPTLSETDGKNILLDTVEIVNVSSSYDKPFDEIVSEVVCRELCFALGVSGRIGLHRYGSKEYQKDFGLMLEPYSPYNGKIGKEYFLTEDEIAALKATVSTIVA